MRPKQSQECTLSGSLSWSQDTPLQGFPLPSRSALSIFQTTVTPAEWRMSHTLECSRVWICRKHEGPKEDGNPAGVLRHVHAPTAGSSEPKLTVRRQTKGIGAFCSPLLATHFSTQRHWSFHFLVSTGLAVTNVISLATVFRGRRQDGKCIQDFARLRLPLPTHFCYRGDGRCGDGARRPGRRREQQVSPTDGHACGAPHRYMGTDLRRNRSHAWR